MTDTSELDDIKKTDIILATIRQCYIFNEMMKTNEDGDDMGPRFDVIQSRLMKILHYQANLVLYGTKLSRIDKVIDEPIEK